MSDAVIIAIIGGGVALAGTLATSIVTLVQMFKTKRHVKEMSGALAGMPQKNRQRGSSTPGNRPIGTDPARDSDARTRRSD